MMNSEKMSLIFKYSIKAIPPSNNKFIGKNQRWQYQSEKKKWARIIQLFCVPRPREPLKKSRVTIIYYFKDKRRRDPDNYSGKFILDGLVQSGIIVDDSFSCIDLKLIGNVDKENPRTEILIEGE
jgi:Holliday junction resolvase RusA-like endonuclease